MPGSRENDFDRKNAFPLYDLYDHALAQEPLPKGVMKVKILVDPSLVIITIYLLWSMPGSREDDF